jgi:hypothetical protein
MLDDDVIGVLVKAGHELHWSEIRNELLPLKTSSERSFTVQISRSLKRLVRLETVERHEKGHKNITYSLNEQALEKHMKSQGSKIHVGWVFSGVYRPGDTWETWKIKAMKKLWAFFEPEFKREWNEEMNKKG